VRGGGRAVILAGVAAGETVATRANFLLDSESRLRAAVAASAAQPVPSAGADHSGHQGHAP
jgi:Cu(I)/Ag(I) efflux system membrane fusion protein